MVMNAFKKVKNKVTEKAKDVFYDLTMVEKDVDALAKHLGNKVAIQSYVEKIELPQRQGVYEAIYEGLIKILADEQAKVLFKKKFEFVARQQLSILWEDFEDATAQEELQASLEKVDKRLAKMNQLKASLLVREQQLLEKRTEILTRLGEKPIKKQPQTVEPVSIPKEEIKTIQENTEIIPLSHEPSDETSDETSRPQEEVSMQEEIAEALLRESQLFGDELQQFDPNLHEEVPPVNANDEIMRGF